MSHRVAGVYLLGAALAFVLTAGAFELRARAQAPAKTVDEGVYSDVQAMRGAASYDTSCGGCHRPDLSGGDGPELKGARFTKNFAGKDVKTLYTKVATTMPRRDPGSLGDNVYLDIVAYLLRENGFPAGDSDLQGEALMAATVLASRPKPPPPVGDFSYVEVVGCLMPGPGNTWVLSNATDPAGVVVTGSKIAATVSTAAEKPLGSNVFRLLDAMAYDPAAHAGKKTYVRGLLIRLPDEQRMTVSALEPVAQGCGR